MLFREVDLPTTTGLNKSSFSGSDFGMKVAGLM